jgi:hypothetical protein
MDKMLLKQIYAGVVTVILEAAKRKFDSAQLRYTSTHTHIRKFDLISFPCLIYYMFFYVSTLCFDYDMNDALF